MNALPYAGIRIHESSTTLSGRIAALLFADQGADVRFGTHLPRAGDEVSEYLDRGKLPADAAALADTADADIVIVDGDATVQPRPSQIVLRIVAALPADEDYGHLPADCCEDLLSATLGYFTDMAIIGPALGRPVVYSPLPVSSVYTGVNAAIAVGAALHRRQRTGRGCEVTAARLAGGLSAIGALALTTVGLDPHLARPARPQPPSTMTAQAYTALLQQAAHDDARRSWLEHRMIPFGVPYLAADGRMVIVINGVNRRATRRLYRHLGIWERLLAAGLVDVSPYLPESVAVRGRNLADSPTLSFASAALVAELLEEIIATKTAAQWEAEFCDLGVAAAQVMTLQEWLNDPHARQAGLTVCAPGSARPQFGRAAWLASAQPYPAPGAASARSPQAAATPEHADASAATPLAGCVVVDLTNVIAGPNCARMFAELGATVYRVEHPDPSHPPIAMTIWAAEAGSGKHSIVLDATTADGREVLERLLRRADVVVANKSDAQCARMGIDPGALQRLNPQAILVQLTAHHGERHGARHDYPGYDPTGQAITGIMARFGTPRCPTYHGLASCVDYLCGYLGTWAGVTALYARERRGDGRGDWAQTSLTAAASLMQLLFQYQEPPACARGPQAVGPTPLRRLYRLRDGWIFALADTDPSGLLDGASVAEALATLRSRGVEAIRVNTVRELADRHRTAPSRTVRFESRTHDGWTTECFVPTWFCFDGAAPASREAAVRIGSSAEPILRELGYSAAAIDRLRSSGTVRNTEWR
jgi:crotonobetainyl-CoA:carnitine CoA-transferase CaiB-like acyl-CoA transferase